MDCPKTRLRQGLRRIWDDEKEVWDVKLQWIASNLKIYASKEEKSPEEQKGQRKKQMKRTNRFTKGPLMRRWRKWRRILQWYRFRFYKQPQKWKRNHRSSSSLMLNMETVLSCLDFFSAKEEWWWCFCVCVCSVTTLCFSLYLFSYLKLKQS